MRIDLLTLFPEMCEAVMAESIIGRARRKGALQVCCHQFRDFSGNKHNRVDDTIFGGGMGMLLMAEPAYNIYVPAGKNIDSTAREGTFTRGKLGDTLRPL